MIWRVETLAFHRTATTTTRIALGVTGCFLLFLATYTVSNIEVPFQEWTAWGWLALVGGFGYSVAMIAGSVLGVETITRLNYSLKVVTVHEVFGPLLLWRITYPFARIGQPRISADKEDGAGFWLEIPIAHEQIKISTTEIRVARFSDSKEAQAALNDLENLLDPKIVHAAKENILERLRAWHARS